MSVETYTIRANGEWAKIQLDECNGRFVANSTIGFFEHIWTSPGAGGLKALLLEMDKAYFFDKTRGFAARVFDHEASVTALRGRVFAARKGKEIDSSTARGLWEETQFLPFDRENFYNQLYWGTDFPNLLKEGVDSVMQEKPCPDCKKFWETIWPAFLEQIRPTVLQQQNQRKTRQRIAHLTMQLTCQDLCDLERARLVGQRDDLQTQLDDNDQAAA